MIKPASEFIAEAQQNCNCLNIADAKTLFDTTTSAVLLDVREPQEAAKSKIDGSINIPRGLLEMKIQQHCSEANSLILIHCAAGGRASLAAVRLQEMGYSNVHAITAKFDDIKTTFD